MELGSVKFAVHVYEADALITKPSRSPTLFYIFDGAPERWL